MRTAMRSTTGIVAFRAVAPTLDRSGRDANRLTGLCQTRATSLSLMGLPLRWLLARLVRVVVLFLVVAVDRFF